MTNTLKVALLSLLFSSTTFKASANQTEQVPYKKIHDNFYVLLSDGDGSNVGINIAEKGVIIVDSMLAKANGKLMATVKTITDKPIKFIVNTHDHMDHTGSNKAFVEHGAMIISHDDLIGLGSMQSKHTDTFGIKSKVGNLNVVQATSHSNTDVLAYFPESNVLMMGDTFTNNWYPSFWAGGLKGQVNVIDKALELSNKDTIVVPGHGFITDTNGLKRYKESTINWVDRIMELHHQGLSAEEIARDKKINQLMASFTNNKRPASDLKGMMEHFIKKTIETELK